MKNKETCNKKAKTTNMHVTYITTLPILAICFIYFALTKWLIVLKDRSAYLFKAMQYIKTVHLHKQTFYKQTIKYTFFYLVTFTRNHFCNKNHNVRSWQAKREGVSVNMFVSKHRHVAWSPGRELLHSGMIAATHRDTDKWASRNQELQKPFVCIVNSPTAQVLHSELRQNTDERAAPLQAMLGRMHVQWYFPPTHWSLRCVREHCNPLISMLNMLHIDKAVVCGSETPSCAAVYSGTDVC